MIETLLYIALGALIVALLVVLVGPLYRRRIERLTTDRLRQATPLSMDEIQADRDQVRAEYALLTYQLEKSATEYKALSHTQALQLEELQAKLRLLQLDLDDKSVTVGMVQDKESVIRDDLRRTETLLNDREKRLEIAESRLKDVEERLQVTTQKLVSADAISQTSKKELTQKNIAFEAVSQALAEASLLRDTYQAERDSLRLIRQDLERMLDREQQKVKSLMRELQAHEKDLDARHDALQVKSELIMDLQSKIAAQAAELVRQADSLADLRLQLSELKGGQQVEQMLAAQHAKVPAVQDLIQRYESEMTQLKTDLGRLEHERQRAQDDLRTLRLQLADKELASVSSGQIVELKVALQRTEQENQKLKNEIDRLKMAADAAQDQPMPASSYLAQPPLAQLQEDARKATSLSERLTRFAGQS